MAAVAATLLTRPDEEPLRWRSVDFGDEVRVAEPTVWVEGDAILVSAGPRSSTGYGVEVAAVVRRGDRIVVRARERSPRLGDPVTARVTYPYRLIVVPRTDEPVRVEWERR